MVAVFSENLRVLNAQNFKKEVSQEGDTRVYFTFGKVTPWANDSAPQQANSSVTSLNEVWDNMIGAKLITGNEIAHVIPRHNWTANTVYDAYDHCVCSLLLFNPNTKFFIVTSDWNVYKCISNNENGAVSTVMPTQIFTDRTIEESDGYVWKYMYTVSDADKIKFTTNNYIPVKTLTGNDGSLQWQVQNNAVSGTIDAIKVTNGGSGYTNASSIVITITGDGSGATALARVNTVSNTVSNVAIVQSGSGYTYADVSISGGGGSGANLRAIISPTGGHGFDPLRELGGSNLILNPRLQSTEGDTLPVTNDIRQVSLIQDPYLYSSTNVASNVVYGQFTTLLLEGATDTVYQQDEIVYQGTSLATATFKGSVLSYANNTLLLTNTQGIPQVQPIVGATTGTVRIPSGSTSIVSPPLQKYTGKLLYIDNITPITRAADQTEDFKILLRF
jgi:hypothetical protein